MGSITSDDSERLSTTNSSAKLVTNAAITVLKVWRAFSSGKYMGTFTTWMPTVSFMPQPKPFLSP